MAGPLKQDWVFSISVGRSPIMSGAQYMWGPLGTWRPDDDEDLFLLARQDLIQQDSLIFIFMNGRFHNNTRNLEPTNMFLNP